MYSGEIDHRDEEGLGWLPMGSNTIPKENSEGQIGVPSDGGL